MKYKLTDTILANINKRFAADDKAQVYEWDERGRLKRNTRRDDYRRALSVANRFNPESIEAGLKELDVESIAERILNLKAPNATNKAHYVRSKDLRMILGFAAWLHGEKEYPLEQSGESVKLDGALTKPLVICINFITPRYESTSGLRKNKKGNTTFKVTDLAKVLTESGYKPNSAVGDASAFISYLHLMGLIERTAYLNDTVYQLSGKGLDLLRRGLKANNL